MKSLLFIYNANSGIGNTLLDIGHKIFSPKTYPCKLCDITYGIFTENKVWKDFRAATDLDLQFYHIDEFESRYPNHSYKYPIILTGQDGQFRPFFTSEEIDNIAHAQALISAIKIKMNLSGT